MKQSTDVPIPESFAYFRIVDSPMAKALKWKLERIAKSHLDVSEELATAFGRAMNTGDALGDAYIDAAFASPKGKARARKDVEQALTGGIASVSDPSPELLALFQQIDTDPEWVDWEKVEHGAEVFRRYSKELYPYFGMVSFPGYALETIAKPLALTGAYTGGTAFGRFLETCRLWTDTTEPGALRPGGAGRRSAVFVRTLHSMIRHTVLPHAEWDRDKLGVPISQFGMFGTLLLSSFAPGQQLKLLGYLPTDDDIAAMMHHWRYVGHLMGVEAPWYPETVTDGFLAQVLISLVEVPNPGKDSQQLCQSFMDTYLPPADARGLRQAYGKLRYKAQLGHARFYLGEESYESTALPDPGLWRYAPLARVIPNLTREALRRKVPGVAGWIDQTHRRARHEFLDKNLEGGQAKFTPVDKLTR
ncbi:MAG TPA: oxygenase MpaB family protein [Kribbella sp.]|uniref:oxygenase MpaB family protein n=1 Tax=Kribbella sp. TaxID=1871183 RepID=UPI002D7663B7|nr:oxygenase MpaB family protein [Kribbella sp.]HET6297302.1 oxygenase MpaB family protein [Kribbella sp.]